ncbi:MULTISPECIES: hypothetical protein [Lactobacillaceae]|uniref:hypothetical protein n=1 Tax=Lactobacillaceae TaxID=33958 RepID=UPI001E498267|nr:MULTISPECIES: hypothetical protein [Lactobacillaceae]MCC4372860.1 hypothetical protein [Limosilactobacillus reuteri]
MAHNKPYSDPRWHGTLDELKSGLKKRKRKLTSKEEKENNDFLAEIEKIVKDKN